jgi:hypothetical protein
LQMFSKYLLSVTYLNIQTLGKYHVYFINFQALSPSLRFLCKFEKFLIIVEVFIE